MKSPGENLYAALAEMYESAEGIDAELHAVRQRREQKVAELDFEVAVLEIEREQMDAAIAQYEAAIRKVEGRGDDG